RPRLGPGEVSGEDLVEERRALLALAGGDPRHHADPVADPHDAALVERRLLDAAPTHVNAVRAAEVSDEDHRAFLDDLGVLARGLLPGPPRAGPEVAPEDDAPRLEKGDAPGELRIDPQDGQPTAIRTAICGSLPPNRGLVSHRPPRAQDTTLSERI